MISPAADNVQDDLLSGLTKSEGEQFMSLLAKTIDSLNEKSVLRFGFECQRKSSDLYANLRRRASRR